MTDAIHTLGENIQLARFAVVEGGAVSSYIHGGGKIGVLVQFDVEGIDPASDGFKQFGRDVAMQVAAAAPVAATRESVDPAIVEHEKAIYMAQAAESGKPEAIQEKMATSRLEKFFKESTLTEQPFVKNPDQSVSEYAAEVAKNLGGEIKIVDFKRFVLGRIVLFRRPDGKSEPLDAEASHRSSGSFRLSSRTEVRSAAKRADYRHEGASRCLAAPTCVLRFGTSSYRPFCFRCDDGGRAASLFL